MDHSKIKTPGHGSTGQTKGDDMRKAGQKLPEDKEKKGMGSKEEPRKFGQNPQGGYKPQHK